MSTKVQKLKQKNSISFYSETNFRKAVQAANELEFNHHEVDDQTKTNNWFGLFLDENNAYWTIKMTRQGHYILYVEDSKVCSINKELEEKLDAFREDQLGSDERSIQSHSEYRAEQNELWANYGYGKI